MGSSGVAQSTAASVWEEDAREQDRCGGSNVRERAAAAVQSCATADHVGDVEAQRLAAVLVGNATVTTLGLTLGHR